MHTIQTEQLTKYYGKVKGIENVNLNVREGEIFGFIGPNGAGKSTTIRTLLGLIRKTSGSAHIFGLDFERDKKKILRNVGYLPSEVFYYDNMTAKQLFQYSARFYQKDCRARIQELSDRLDLDVRRKIEDLSLGNKKKVGIIQGLLHSPKLIVLDEPTSGLDPLMQKTFYELIEEENKNGVTVLFSSHVLSEVQRISNRVAIIKDGTIVQTRRISELRDNTYKKVQLTPQRAIAIDSLHRLGVSDLKQDGHMISFIYQGDCNALLQALAQIPLHNIEIMEPDLEEIFLHYYQSE